MVVLRAGLEHHGDGAAGADAVVGTVIAVEGLELGDGVLRGQVHKAAAAAAVVLLAAIDEVDVVGGSGAVEADAVGGGQRIHAAEGGKVVGDAEAEGGQGGHIASVGGKLLNLLAADQGAHFAGLSLHLQGVGRDGHGLSLGSYRERDIFFERLGHIHDDVGHGVVLEALGRDRQRIVADADVGETIGSCAVGDCFSDRVCGLVLEGDLGVGNEGPAGIGDRSVDGGVVLCPGARG